MGLLNEDQLNDIMSNVHVCDEDWFEELLRMWNDRQTTKQVQIEGNTMGDDIMQIKKVRRNAIIPQFQTEGAAAIDLCACLNESWLLTPETSVLIHTGIAIHIADKSVVGLIVPRSGLGFNYGVGLMNTVGVIDSDYQGEIMVKLRMTHGDSYRIQPNERIAQMFFVPVLRPIFEEVEEFSAVTERGVGGFGSTGK